MFRLSICGAFLGLMIAGCAQQPVPAQSAYVPLSALYSQSCGQLSDQIATLRKITEDKDCGARSAQAPITIGLTPKYGAGASGADTASVTAAAAATQPAVASPAVMPATVAAPVGAQTATSGQAVPASVAKPMMTIDDAMRACEALSVPTGTEQFGKCVLTLSGANG